MMIIYCCLFFCSSRRRHTRCALVTGVQTCALPICYLTVPFSLTMPGVQVWDIDPLEEDGELWQGVRVVMPDEIATHSRAQEFYFGDDMFIRRQDYTLDIAGGHRIANYALDIVSVDGLKFASKRRAYRSEEHTSELQSPMRISYAVFCFKKNKKPK